MKTAIICNVPQYEVTSYGNGLSYQIKRKCDGASILLQSQDDCDGLRELLGLVDSPKSNRYNRLPFAEILDSEYGDALDAAIMAERASA